MFTKSHITPHILSQIGQAIITTCYCFETHFNIMRCNRYVHKSVTIRQVESKVAYSNNDA